MINQDIDECSTNSTCKNGSVCQNTVGSFNCLCQTGYQYVNEICECKISFKCKLYFMKKN